MKIKLATRADANRIFDLRKQAYRVATNTKLLHTDFLKWDNWDKRSLVFYVENDQKQAVSSMRALKLFRIRDIEKVFDITLHTTIELPVLIMDRATTLVQYRRRGFSAAIRYLMIKSCINSPIKNIAATVNAGVSRIPHLKELGYTFEAADISHRKQLLFQNTSEVILGKLHHSRFVEASSIAVKKLKTPLSFFEFEKSHLNAINTYLNSKSLDS